MKNTIALTLLLMMIAFYPHTSHSAEYWYKTYGGSSHDYANAIQQTTDDGYILAGHTNSFDTYENDAWVIKLDSNGEVSWQRTYGGSSDDFAKSIQQTSDGNFIVLITGVPFDHNCVQKLNTEGDIIWQKDYGGLVGRALQLTSDGGYILAGNQDLNHALIIKLDSEGNVIWRKYYLSGEFTSIQQTTDAGYIVAGNYMHIESESRDFWVMKLESNGNITWQKRYGGSNNDSAQSIQQTTDGGYIVAGYISNRDLPGDCWVLKLDSNGAISWQKIYDGGDDELCFHIKQTSDDGYIVTGSWSSFSGTWIIKLDNNGNVIWQKAYDGAYIRSIRETTDAGFIVAGSCGFGADGWNIGVMKIDSNGDIPGCNISETTEAVVTETYIQARNTNITAEIGSLNFTEATNAVQDTTASIATVCSSDSDDDGIPNNEDNCPSIANPNQEDGDEDGVGDVCDNCPDDYNPLQEDTYPPQGNGIGDACDCEGDFNCSGGVDANDVNAFLEHFGRSQYNRPCSIEDPCSGDFSCDGDVDGEDVTKFLEDFGRGQYSNPCPQCSGEAWCVYP